MSGWIYTRVILLLAILVIIKGIIKDIKGIKGIGQLAGNHEFLLF